MIIGVAYSPNGKVLASGGWDKLVRLWDPDTGKELSQLTGHGGAIYGIAISPDNLTLASGSEDKTIVLKLGGREQTFKGMQYLLGFAQPNFYFHVTAAYAILRHNGVELGKRDYIGTP